MNELLLMCTIAGRRAAIPAIEVQYGCSGRYFGVSVRDGGGSLTRARLLDYLGRAKSGAAHIETKAGGAGLGLISVLRSVSKLVFNLDPGNSTEVIAIFDMELFAKGKVGARSLHLFTQAPSAEPGYQDEGDEGDDSAPAVGVAGGSSAGKWILVVVLMCIVSVMATAFVLKRGDDASASAAEATPTLSVVVTPPDAQATITLDGQTFSADTAQPVPASGPLVLEVTSAKYGDQNVTIDRATLKATNQVLVNLAPKPRRRGNR